MHVLTALERDRIADLLRRDEFFWLDLTAPSAQDLAALAQALQVEEDAVVALREESGVPRLDDSLEGHVVLVYFGVDRKSRTAIEVRLLISGRYMVTNHDERCIPLKDLAHQSAGVRERDEGLVVYKVLGALTDSFFDTLDDIDREIEDLEDTVMARARRSDLHQLVAAGRSLVPLRKIAVRQAHALGRAKHEIAGLPGLQARPHDLDDLYQRMASISELIESSRTFLTAAKDVYLNSVTERLTLVATVFFPLTVLTGFFGMNFGWMVEHVDSFTAFAILGVGGMLALTLGVLLLFWRAGYLGPRTRRGYH